jgi:hypothetical protein
LAILSLIIGCADSSTFSENEARNALAAAIQEGGQGKITLLSFKKTDGQKSEANGIRIYQFDFEAQIQFEANGSWLKGMAMDPRLSFQFAAPVNTGSWAGFNNQMKGGIAVTRGGRATISGSIVGQKTENGWKTEIGASRLVSGPTASSASTAPSTAQVASSPIQPSLAQSAGIGDRGANCRVGHDYRIVSGVCASASDAYFSLTFRLRTIKLSAGFAGQYLTTY